VHSVLCVESSLARLAGQLHLIELLDIVSQLPMVQMLRAQVRASIMAVNDSLQ
jgi:hypothetical protein